MTERIDIVVTDKVDASAEQKLLSMAKAARESHKAVGDLQAQIAKGNSVYLQQEAALNRAVAAEQKAIAAANAAASSQAQLQAAITKKTAADAQAANTAAASAARLTAAQQQAATAAIGTASAQTRAATATAIAQQKLATEVQRTGIAYVQAEAALNRAIAAEARATAAVTTTATAQQKLATETAKTAAAEDQAAAAATRLATSQFQATQAITTAATAQQRAAQQLALGQQQIQAAVARTAAAQTAASAAAQVAAQRTAASQSQATAAAQRAATAAAQTVAAQQRVATATQATAAATQRATAATFAADAAYVRLQTTAIGTAAAQQRLAQATSQAAAAKSRAEAAALRLEQAQGRAARGGGGLVNSLLGLGATAIGVGTAFSFLQTKLEETQAYTNLQNKLRLVASGQDEVQQLTNKLLDAANRARAPLEEFGTTFQRINSAIIQTGGSQKEAIAITEALTKTISISGKSSSEQASALLQVSQAFNKGKLDGDEFRTVMEVLPEFADKLAQSLGLANRGLLFEASKSGKINLDVMRDAMRRLGDTADANLGKSVGTVDQAFTRLKNSSIVLTGRLDEALGVSQALARVLNSLADASQRSAEAQAGASPQAALDAQRQILANLDKQIAAKDQLRLAGTGGVAIEQSLNRLYETRANVLKTISQLSATTQTTANDDILARRAAEQQAINAKNAADAAAKAKVDAKENASEEKRAASKRRSELEEIERLREKTFILGDVTELQRVNDSIAAGRYKTLRPLELQELRDLANARDLITAEMQAMKLRQAEADKIAAGDAQRIANAEQLARSLQQETIALELESQSLNANAFSLAVINEAKQQAVADSIQFQSDRIKAVEGITAETAALDAQAEAIRRNAQLKTQIEQDKFVQQNSGLQQAPSDLFANTAESEAAQVAIYAQANEQIDKLLEARKISEQTAANARLKINVQAQQAQLVKYTDFFDNLATLSNSKNKTIAAIGKAAAIANTTIKTYESATSAYASLAGIPIVGPALGAAAAAAAIAAGLANVQAIRSQGGGFQAGGYTGDGATNAAAGLVHGKEYVFDAPSTARIGVANLEAIRRGNAQRSGGMQLIVNNLGTPQSYAIQSVTEERVYIIARDVAEDTVRTRAPEVVAANTNEPNSVMSKSVQRNFDTQRKR